MKTLALNLLCFLFPVLFVGLWQSTDSIYAVKDIYDDYNQAKRILSQVGKQVSFFEKAKTMYFERNAKGNVLPLIYFSLAKMGILNINKMHLTVVLFLHLLLFLVINIYFYSQEKHKILLLFCLIFSTPLYLQEATHIDTFIITYSLVCVAVLMFNKITAFFNKTVVVFLLSLAGAIRPIETLAILFVVFFLLYKKEKYLMYFVLAFILFWWWPFLSKYFQHISYRLVHESEILFFDTWLWNIILPYVSISSLVLLFLLFKYGDPIKTLSLFVITFFTLIYFRLNNFQYYYIFALVLILFLMQKSKMVLSSTVWRVSLIAICLQWGINVYAFFNHTSLDSFMVNRPVARQLWKDIFSEMELADGDVVVLDIEKWNGQERFQIKLLKEYLQFEIYQAQKDINIVESISSNHSATVICPDGDTQAANINDKVIHLGRNLWPCTSLILCGSTTDIKIKISKTIYACP